MKPKLILCLALILSGGLFGCSSISIKTSTKVEDPPPVTLGFARVELSEGDTNAVPAPSTNYCLLSFIWVKGKHTMHDAEPWCGDGEKYGGKFIFRVEFADGKTVDTPLESLCPDGCFDFIYAEESQPWQIKMADYNNDGQPDFNIVTYAGCNLSESHLFTITLSGKIEALKIEGMDSLVMNRTDEQSSDEFNGSLTPTGFYYEFYDRQHSTLDVESFDWDVKQKVFHQHDYVIQSRQ